MPIANGASIRVFKLGIIAFFGESKLSTSEQKETGNDDYAHIISVMYKLLTLPKS